MLFQPVFNRLNAGFNVLAERCGKVHAVAPLHKPLHGLLVVVRGVLGAGASEVVLGPGPETLDGHEV